MIYSILHAHTQTRNNQYSHMGKEMKCEKKKIEIEEKTPAATKKNNVNNNNQQK